MDDLLKEAIADAKAVRETALENAKLALEEAFTPKLQSMLSQKIQTEMEDEDPEERMHAEDDPEERMHAEDDPEERMHANDDPEERMHDEDEDMDEGEHEDEKEEGAHEGIIEIDGVKYAPVVAEEEDDEKEEGMHDEDDDMDEDLDLESVIKELESELEEGEHEDDDDKEEGMHENDVSSNIGSGDNKVDKKANDSTGIGAKNSRTSSALTRDMNSSWPFKVFAATFDTNLFEEIPISGFREYRN